jgi:hypothetical protein
LDRQGGRQGEDRSGGEAGWLSETNRAGRWNRTGPIHRGNSGTLFSPPPRQDFGKEDRLRMDTDLRIPLTSEQKTLIDEATADEPEGKAAWARAILIRAAHDRLAKAKLRKAERG